MDNNSVVEQIVNSLAFEVEAVPDQTLIPTTTTKATPLNVKIRVKKKQDAGLKHGVLAVPDNRKDVPQRIRLISSDQTILSFNVVMEDVDFEKPTKTRKPLLARGKLDEDSYKEESGLPTKRVSSHSNEVIKGNLVFSKVHSVTSKQNKDIFGKCKRGGCLDPPYGEDKYSYKLAKEELKDPIQDSVTKSRTSSIFGNKLFKRKTKAKPENVPAIINSQDNSILSLYGGSLDTSDVESNSIITYPSILDTKDQKTSQEKRGSRTSDILPVINLMPKTSNLENGSLYIVPKKTRKSSDPSQIKLDDVKTDEQLLVKETLNAKISIFSDKEIPSTSPSNDIIISEEEKHTNKKGLIAAGILTSAAPVAIGAALLSASPKSSSSSKESFTIQSDAVVEKPSETLNHGNTETTQYLESPTIGKKEALFSSPENFEDFQIGENKNNEKTTAEQSLNENDLKQSQESENTDEIPDVIETPLSSKLKSSKSNESSLKQVSVKSSVTLTEDSGNKTEILDIDKYKSTTSPQIKPSQEQNTSDVKDHNIKNNDNTTDYDEYGSNLEDDKNVKDIWKSEKKSTEFNTSLTIDEDLHPNIIQQANVIGKTNDLEQNDPFFMNSTMSHESYKQILRLNKISTANIGPLSFKTSEQDEADILENAEIKITTQPNKETFSIPNENITNTILEENQNEISHSFFDKRFEALEDTVTKFIIPKDITPKDTTQDENQIMNKDSGKVGYEGNNLDNISGISTDFDKLKEIRSTEQRNEEKSSTENNTSESISSQNIKKIYSKRTSTESIRSKQHSSLVKLSVLPEISTVNNINSTLETEEQPQTYQNDLKTDPKKGVNDVSSEIKKKYSTKYNDHQSNGPPKHVEPKTQKNKAISLKDQPLSDTCALKVQPLQTVLEKHVPVQIDLAFHIYMNKNNEKVIKSFDGDKTPQRYPNDSVVVAKCDLKDPFDLKLPIDSKSNLRVQVINSKTKLKIPTNVSEYNQNVTVLKKTQENEKKMKEIVLQETAKFVKNRPNNWNDEKAVAAIFGTYAKELEPLQDTIKQLKQDVEDLTKEQMIFREKVFTRKTLQMKLTHGNRKCGCAKVWSRTRV